MKILGPPIISIVIIILSIIFCYRYWIVLRTFSIKIRVLIFLIRILNLLFIFLLVLNPWYAFSYTVYPEPKLNIVLDNSESMQYHYKSANINPDNLIDKLEYWIDSNNYESNFYKLIPEITLMNNSYNYEPLTNFSNLEDFIFFNDMDQLLLITDGQATSGKKLDNLNFTTKIPINILGVGNSQNNNDIIVQDVDILSDSNLKDKIKVKVRVSSNLISEETTVLQIINQKSEIIYDSTITFDRGIQINEFQLLLSSKQVTNINYAFCLPLINEVSVENNKITFRNELRTIDKEVIIISGELSANTKIIKTIFNNIEAINIKHYFRFNETEWNKSIEKIDLSASNIIVLDNFPIYDNDYSLLDEIKSYSKLNEESIIYIEGPGNNLSSGQMIQSLYPAFAPKVIDDDLATKLLLDSRSELGKLNFDYSLVPPLKRSIKWFSEGAKKLIDYDDGSIFFGQYNNFFLISAPNLSKIHYRNINNIPANMKSILYPIISYAYYNKDGFIELNINKTSFNIGEKYEASFSYVENIGLDNFILSLIHNDDDSTDIFCDKFISSNTYDCQQTFTKAGKYTIQVKSKMPNGDIFRSNKVEVVVQNQNIEFKNLTQDKIALNKLAYKTGGIFMDIQLLDSMLQNIEMNSSKIVRKYEISALSTQKYWYILVLLFAIEWYFRKKIGLL